MAKTYFGCSDILRKKGQLFGGPLKQWCLESRIRCRFTDGDAVVLGAHVILSPDMYIHASKAQMLSRAGRCATFDQSAEGFVRGEGVGAAHLAALFDDFTDDAHQDLREADLLGTATNQNGRSTGLTKPRCEAQVAVIQTGLLAAAATGCEILAHEVHGTGTC